MRQFLGTIFCAVTLCSVSAYAHDRAASPAVMCASQGGSYCLSLDKGSSLLEQYDTQGMLLRAVADRSADMIVEAHGLCMQSDGKIIIAARVLYEGVHRIAVMRYEPEDLSLDVTFGQAGMNIILGLACADHITPGVAVQPDGTIMVTSAVTTAAGDQPCLIKLSSQGVVDPTFGRSGIARLPRYVSSLTSVYPKIIHGNLYCHLVPTTDHENSIFIRVMHDGSLDARFGQQGGVVATHDQSLCVGAAFDVSQKNYSTIIAQSDDMICRYRYDQRGTLLSCVAAEKPEQGQVIDCVSLADDQTLLVMAVPSVVVHLMHADGSMQEIDDRDTALQLYLHHRIPQDITTVTRCAPQTGSLVINKIFCYEGCCPVIFGHRGGVRVMISQEGDEVVEESMCAQITNKVFNSALTVEQFNALVADCQACCGDNVEDPFDTTWQLIADIQQSACNKFMQTWTVIAAVEASFQFQEFFTAIVEHTDVLNDKFEQTWTILAALDTPFVTLSVTATTDLTFVFTALAQMDQILLQEFQETWTFLEALQAQIDLSGVYTALNAYEQNLCQDFQETWTMLAAVDQMITDKFQQTWTALVQLQDESHAQFQETWTIIEGMEAFLSTQFDQAFADIQQIENLIRAISTTQVQEFLLTISILDKLTGEIMDTVNSIEATLESFFGLENYLSDLFDQTWTAIEGMQDNIMMVIDNQTTLMTSNFLATTTALNAFQSHMSQQFQQTFTVIAQSVPCDATPIFASMTISVPGTYCLAQDISGTITIAASNVILDLNGHQVSATSGDVIALNSGLSNITIRNGYVVGVGSTNGIHAVNVTNLLIEYVGTQNSSVGIRIDTATSKFITIRNCRLLNGTFGIDISNASEAVITDCFMSSHTTAGLRLTTVSNSSIARCMLTSNASGILLQGCTGCVIDGCILRDQTGGASAAGILCNTTASSNIVIKNNMIASTAGTADGIRAEVAISKMSISDNLIHANSGNGIFSNAGFTDVTITNNVITENSDRGIILTTVASSNIVVQNNEITGNTIGGIQVVSGGLTNASINNNLISGNDTATSAVGGIKFDVAVSKISIEGNSIVTNGNATGNIGGITAVDTVTDMAIKNNQISSNTGNGIIFSAASRSLTIQNNQIADNTVNGIQAAAGLNQSSILANQIVGSGANQVIGINLLGSSTNLCIENNCIARHTGRGIVATALTNSVIKDNEVERNAGDGILIDGASSDVVIQDNSITGNTGDGVEVSSATATTLSNFLIANNVITGNTANGITITPAAAVTVTFEKSTLVGNTISGNTIGLNIAATTGTLIAQQLCVEQNVISGNSNNGILTFATDSVFIANRCLRNSSSGIANGGSDSSFRQNICNNNAAGGIVLANNASNCTLNGNECNSNAIGILFDTGVVECTIANNTCSKNLVYGITIPAGSIDHNLYKNICNRNGAYGFEKGLGSAGDYPESCSFVLNKAHRNFTGATTDENYRTSTGGSQSIPFATIGTYTLSTGVLAGQPEDAGAVFTNLSIIT